MKEGGEKAEGPTRNGSPAVVIYGAGAVGCFFGSRLVGSGPRVTLVGRPSHVDAIARDGLLFESGPERRRVPMDATTDAGVVAQADIVLVCVKTRDTAAAARTIRPMLKPGAIVVSLQNGVDNVPRMRAEGLDAIAAVVYVGASMPGPGHLLHAGSGHLVIGEYGLPADGSPAGPRVEQVASIFEAAGVACRISIDVRQDLWRKLIVNCAYNAMSAIGRARYGTLVDRSDTRAVLADLIGECAAVARAEGIELDPVESLIESALALGRGMAPAISSTAQDLIAGRPTEIDSLNGHVAELGRIHRIPTPVNSALAAMVRLIEISGTA